MAEQETYLDEQDLTRIERSNPNGLTSAQIISIFQARGVRLSEATFRKYVQLGLLPRCRRVGSKGKHRGSHGVYPCATVRRINSIKRMIAQSFTIEQIQRSFSDFRRQIEAIESMLDELFKGFEREIFAPRFDHALRHSLHRDIDSARRTATQLISQATQIEAHIVWHEQSRVLPDPSSRVTTTSQGRTF